MSAEQIQAQVQPYHPLDVVLEQAEDAGLWFEAQTAPEAYLQAALRRLHDAIEQASNNGSLTREMDAYRTWRDKQ